MTRTELNRISAEIFDAARQVHQHLGPGFASEVYMACLHHELRLKGLKFRKQAQFPLIYKGVTLPMTLTLNTVVEEEIPINIVDSEEIQPIQQQHMLSQLKLCNKRLGVIITFNVANIIKGYRKAVLTN